MPRWIITFLISLLLVLLQTTVVHFVAIGSIVPDLLMIWIVALAIHDGQITATTAGFLIGTVIDLLSGSDGMLGLSALSKTLAGFLAGYFYNENKTFQSLGTYRFILILVGVTLVHNLIYFIIFLQGSGIRWWGAALDYGIPSTIYTAAVGVLPMFVVARKYLS